MKRIYANWKLKFGENEQLKLTIVGETGLYWASAAGQSWTENTQNNAHR